MKRIFAFVLVLCLMLTLAPFASAASDEANEAANALYELGLFQGTAENADGTPVFDLDRLGHTFYRRPRMGRALRWLCLW